jgi:hypothetical protein
METMTTIDQTLQILDMTNYLIDQEKYLWDCLQNAELIFGTDSDMHCSARARWFTTNEILKQFLLITNNN